MPTRQVLGNVLAKGLFPPDQTLLCQMCSISLLNPCAAVASEGDGDFDECRQCKVMSEDFDVHEKGLFSLQA
jgi:hypothetical protein